MASRKYTRVPMWKRCTGQAHSGEYDQDHCMVCLPHWEIYPVCVTPGCNGRKLGHSQCLTCKKYYDLTKPDPKLILRKHRGGN